MKKKEKIKETVYRLIILLVGLTIAHLGVTLFLLSDLGSDPFNVLVQGLFRTISGAFSFLPLTHGRTHIAVCFLIIIVLLIVDRSYIKAGTILCMICGGPIIDMFSFFLQGVFNNTCHFVVRVAGLAAGCVILAFGMTIVIKSEAGTGPNDLVGVVISDKTHFKFSIVRIAVDGVFVLGGFFLGGEVGIGTIICVAIVGPVAGIFLPHNEKLIKKILSKLI